jgi:hypothetical protein
MPNIKPQKLPDRKLVKLTVSMTPELRRALEAYSAYYKASYGEEVTVTDLIPAMLVQFLARDRGFAKARKALAVP